MTQVYFNLLRTCFGTAPRTNALHQHIRNEGITSNTIYNGLRGTVLKKNDDKSVTRLAPCYSLFIHEDKTPITHHYTCVCVCVAISSKYTIKLRNKTKEEIVVGHHHLERIDSKADPESSAAAEAKEEKEPMVETKDSVESSVKTNESKDNAESTSVRDEGKEDAEPDMFKDEAKENTQSSVDNTNTTIADEDNQVTRQLEPESTATAVDTSEATAVDAKEDEGDADALIKWAKNDKQLASPAVAKKPTSTAVDNEKEQHTKRKKAKKSKKSKKSKNSKPSSDTKSTQKTETSKEAAEASAVPETAADKESRHRSRREKKEKPSRRRKHNESLRERHTAKVPSAPASKVDANMPNTILGMSVCGFEHV